MDKTLSYRKAILAALDYPMQGSNSDMPNVQAQLIVDEERDSFAMFLFGWYKHKYIHNLMFHLELKEDQIWIYQNNTDYLIDEALIEEGVEENDIVAAWEMPYELENLQVAA